MQNAESDGKRPSETNPQSLSPSPEHWRRVKAIFQSAIEMEPHSRPPFLDVECNGDESLRHEVERMLASDESNPGFLEDSPIDLNQFTTNQNSFIGKLIGPYRLVEEIGRGGMGAVYLAERTDEFEKQVAIKIIKRGMDSDDMLRRFRNERQILAHLDHPNIARLLDGGTTEDGLPFFVMEYVQGSVIDEYCDSQALTINGRVELFREVCAAVSYAHRHLAIHRDIKPSNILVTDDGEPKLLDFGIAKLLTPDAEGQTFTSAQLMTPEYASPEQVRGDTSITTATDVYSLGVVLYELLTGCSPYDFPNYRPDEVARAICDTEPPKPSKRIADLTAHPKTNRNSQFEFRNSHGIPNQNSQSAIRNSKFLKGDLDNVVLMALRKDPARRYSTVDQFSEDLRRYLAGLPVSARADTLRYRTTKFVQRNKAASIAAVLLVVAILAGIGATLYQARRAEKQRLLAEKRFNEVRELAHSVVFKYHDAIERLAGSTQVREMLVKDALTYLDRLSQDASGDRSLQRELGLAYLKVADVQGKAYSANVGDTAGAVISYRKAIALFESLANSAPKGDEQSRADLRDAYQALVLTMGVSGDAETFSFVTKARLLSEELASSYPESIDYKLKLARSYMLESDMVSMKPDDHVALFQKARVILEAVSQADPNRTEPLYHLGTIYQRLGDRLRRAAKVAENEGDQIEAGKLYLASTENHQLSKQAVQKLLEKDPDNNRYQRLVAVARNNYGEALVSSGNPTAAVEEIKAAFAYFERNANTDIKNANARYELGLARQALASALLMAGDRQNAFQQYASAIKVFDALRIEDPSNREYSGLSFLCAAEFGDTLLALRDFAGAMRQYESLYHQSPFPENTNEQQMKASGRLSTIHEKLGDTYAAMAEAAKGNSGKLWMSAREEYQKATEGRPAARVEQLQKKIARCDKTLNGD
jgi:serine/threonine protein kinase